MSTTDNNSLAESAKKRAKRVYRKKSENMLIQTEELPVVQAVSAVLNTIELNPVKKIYMSWIRRFRVQDNLSRVEYILKNGDSYSTNFVLEKPTGACNPEIETYLLKEDEHTFQCVHHTVGHTKREVAIAIYYDDMGRPVFTQEYQ